MSGPQPNRQNELLKFLRAQVEAHGISPTFDEMRAHLGLASKGRVAAIIDSLERRGLIRRIGKRQRSIQLVQTKDYHLPGCGCDRCARARYLAQLKLIQGLKVDPPAAVVSARLVGIRLLSQDTRVALLGQPVNAAPRTRTALPPRAS